MTEEHYVLTLETDRSSIEDLAGSLREAWNLEPVLLEKTGESTCWVEVYFEDGVTAELARAACASRNEVRAAVLRHFGKPDWDAMWKKHFKRHPVGQRLEVCPVWENNEAVEEGRTRLLINPGLSFGTGEHFTTRFCLEMLDELCQKSRPASCWDVGAGSGILALAAVKLGVERVVGWENDPRALAQARENAVLNGQAHAVEWCESDITVDPPDETFDIVCANLFSGLLIDCAPVLWRATRDKLVITGIREVEVDGVADTYAHLGGMEKTRDGDGEWAGIVFERSP